MTSYGLLKFLLGLGPIENAKFERYPDYSKLTIPFIITKMN